MSTTHKLFDYAFTILYYFDVVYKSLFRMASANGVREIQHLFETGK